MVAMQDNVVLSMRNISKSFPGVRALQNVDFTLRKGEIHALMGENGAGKSTLIKVLTGVYPKDSGRIFLDLNGGLKEINVRSPHEAQTLGISTVYQGDNPLPQSYCCREYVYRPGQLPSGKLADNEKRATEILEKFNIPARATQQLDTCSIAEQQIVAIARAVDMDCKVLILDEPTSSLDEQEVEKLFP